ncbi:MAG: hypothetical protein AWM53_01589 [Candidatus Dichloromethanomonas elyunquensis]|nr:MAG: hypothetical protein AWM53_01589 [Candidatus Dichloromethanomonas elyunquensis]
MLRAKKGVFIPVLIVLFILTTGFAVFADRKYYDRR